MIVAAKVRNAARAVERKAIKKYTDTEKHDVANRIAALAILEDIAKYGGESAALVRWSRMFMKRTNGKRV